jgi:hypothetical protein
MRTYILSTAILALAATPAFATIGDGHGNGPKSKTARIRVVNSSELGIEVSINGDPFNAVEPGGFVEGAMSVSSKSEATVTARLLGAPAISAIGTGAVQANKTTVASVSATTAGVSVSFSKPGQVAKFAREAGVALASTGGLLPLLWLGMLLGRRPQRRQRLAARAAN